METLRSKKGLVKISIFSGIIGTVVLLVFCLCLLTNSYLQQVKQNIDVIQFSMEKPNLVRKLKTDYSQKIAQIEKSYDQQQPTNQEKLLQELTKQLQSSK